MSQLTQIESNYELYAKRAALANQYEIDQKNLKKKYSQIERELGEERASRIKDEQEFHKQMSEMITNFEDFQD